MLRLAISRMSYDRSGAMTNRSNKQCGGCKQQGGSVVLRQIKLPRDQEGAEAMLCDACAIDLVDNCGCIVTKSTRVDSEAPDEHSSA